MKKKHELLKYAYDNYPKGTICKWGRFGNEITSTGQFNFNDDYIVTSEDFAVYDGSEWAEIVTDKIAVKVENELQFKALMKFYASKGWESIDGDIPLNVKYNKSERSWRFENNFGSSEGKNHIEMGYQIIPFSDFAKQHNIKVPLLISEDGEELYEGEEFWHVVYGKLGICNPITLEVKQKFDEEIEKVFSTKQSALQWIEAQKPKEIIVSPDSSFPIIVRKNPICGDEYIHLDMSKIDFWGNRPNIYFTISELREAVKAYDTLHS